MRLAIFALIGVFCIAYSYALPGAETQNDLLSLADQGQAHANEGDREARQWLGGRGYGGWGRGGYGGGWGRGWGRGGGWGWGGGWGRGGGWGWGR